MRISLDYYRVLGVPPQVTDEQLVQAYEDRRIQFPRREHSDEAIIARQGLLEQAYNILKEPQSRLAYDQQLLNSVSSASKTLLSDSPLTETDASIASSENSEAIGIEVTPENIVGILIVLSELGEYETVVQVGEEAIASKLLESSDDIYLSLGLAYLELSRERWHQNAYERATESGQKGLYWLEKNPKFSKIQREIERELNWLRPYRILELLAQPLSRQQSRQRGLQLLQEMLDERQGIEGKGEDYSGLDVDDFLRFIQQLRVYLTLNEQLSLFQSEVQRPSLVATYLAVYALIAQGVFAKDPHTIVQANDLLEILNKRQDVSLEKAICALLLGQTKVANDALQQSQDREALDFIRRQSQDSPDLVPGLYAYSKRWLEKEVFANFRDLAQQNVSLTEYFADETVVSYLEAYLEDSPQKSPETTVNAEQPVGVTMANALPDSSYPLSSRRSNRRKGSPRQRYSNGIAQPKAAQFPSEATEGSKSQSVSPNWAENAPASDRVLITESYRQPPTAPSSRRSNPPRRQVAKGKTEVASQQRKKGRRKSKIKIKPLLFLIGAVGGVGLLVGFGLKSLYASRSPVAELNKSAVLIQISQPVLEIPPENARLILPTGLLTLEGARDVVETWLNSKVRAFGSEYQVEELGRILANPLAKTWESRVKQLKNSQSYWKYRHELEIESLNTNPTSPELATVDAKVKEVADLYQNGRINQGRSYQEDLTVRYTLAQQEGSWKIKGIQVLP